MHAYTLPPFTNEMTVMFGGITLLVYTNHPLEGSHGTMPGGSSADSVYDPLLQ